MSARDDRQNELIDEATALRDFYVEQRLPDVVTLFEEDFDWLMKRKAIIEFDAAPGLWLDGKIKVRRGPRKKRARRKRPPELALGF